MSSEIILAIRNCCNIIFCNVFLIILLVTFFCSIEEERYIGHFYFSKIVHCFSKATAFCCTMYSGTKHIRSSCRALMMTILDFSCLFLSMNCLKWFSVIVLYITWLYSHFLVSACNLFLISFYTHIYIYIYIYIFPCKFTWMILRRRKIHTWHLFN